MPCNCIPSHVVVLHSYISLQKVDINLSSISAAQIGQTPHCAEVNCRDAAPGVALIRPTGAATTEFLFFSDFYRAFLKSRTNISFL